MDDREKLYAMFAEAVRNCDPATTCLVCRHRAETDCMEKLTADYLIDNGVVRETGKWVLGQIVPGYATPGGNSPWVCSECKVVVSWSLSKPNYNFCPNCGADMREVDNAAD